MSLKKITKSLALSMLLALASTSAHAYDGGRGFGSLSGGIAYTFDTSDTDYYIGITPEGAAYVNPNPTYMDYSNDSVDGMFGAEIGFVWDSGVGISLEAQWNGYDLESSHYGQKLSMEADLFNVYFHVSYRGLAACDQDSSSGFFFSAGIALGTLYNVEGDFGFYITDPDIGPDNTQGYVYGTFDDYESEDLLISFKARAGWEMMVSDCAMFGIGISYSYVFDDDMEAGYSNVNSFVPNTPTTPAGATAADMNYISGIYDYMRLSMPGLSTLGFEIRVTGLFGGM
jgi:hypothetical protein